MTCKKHGEVTPIVSEYFSTKRNAIRISKKCPECNKEKCRNYYAKHSEKIKQQNAEYKRQNPEKVKEWAKKWTKNNWEKRYAHSRNWILKHPEKSSEYCRRWSQNNPEKVIAKRTRRRAMLSGAEINDFTGNEWKELLKEFNYTCAYCGCNDKKLTQDHIIPLKLGGNHTKSNIVPACQSCNSRKGIKIWDVSYGR